MIESVLYKKAKGGDLLACIFWLKPHRADIYDRKQVVAVAGDPDNPLSVDHTHHLDAGTVHIYIPDNGRNQTDTLLEPEPDFIRERREAYVATRTLDATPTGAPEQGDDTDEKIWITASSRQ